MSVGRFLDDVGHTLKTGAKKVKKGATNLVHDTPAWLDEGLRGAQKGAHVIHLDDATKTVNKHVIAPTVKLDQFLRNSYVSRSLATPLLLQDSEAFKKNGWRKAWKDSEHVSPGRALAWNAAGQVDALASTVGVDNPAEWASRVPSFGAGKGVENFYENVTGSGGKPAFDILNKDQRDNVFSHGAGSLTSGTLDAVASWFTDPLVIAGKGVAVGKALAVTKPIRRGTNVKKASESTRVSKVIEHAHSLPPDRRYAWAMRHPAMKGNSQVADLIASSPNAEATRAALKSAMDGSQTNYDQLAARSNKLAIAVEELRDARIPLLQKALAPTESRFKANPTHPAYKGSPQQKADIAETALKASQADLINAEEDHRIAELMRTSWGSIKVVPRGTGTGLRGKAIIPARKGATVPAWTDEVVDATKTKTRVGIAKAAGGWGGVTWWTYQPSKYNAPMRVLKSASTRRPGNVILDKPGHPAEMIGRWLDRIGHGVGKPMDPALKDRLVGKVGQASNGTKSDLINALQQAESAGIHHMGAVFGMHPDAVEGVIKRTFFSRQNVIEGVAGGEKGAFSGAQDATGKWVDQVVTEDGALVHMPLFSTDLANSHALIDSDRLTKVFRRHQHDLAGAEGAHFARALSALHGEMGIAGKVADRSTEALESFNRFWKPSVLARLGYAPRVMADSEFRAISVLGAVNAIPLTVSSGWQGFKTGNTAMRAKGLATTHARHKAVKAAAAMEPARAEGAAHKNIVDQLQVLTAKDAVAAGKVGQAHDALQNPMPDHMRTHWTNALHQARAEQAANAETWFDLTAQRNRLAEWTDEMNTDYLGHLDDATKPIDRPLGSPQRPLKFSQPYKFRSRGQVVQVPGAFGGPVGDMFFDASGFQNNARSLAGIKPRYLNKLRIQAGQSTTITPLPPTRFDQLAHDVHIEAYDRGWEKAVNDQIGKSPAGRLMLQGRTDDEVKRWMKGSPEGRKMVSQFDSITRKNIDDWVGRMRMHLDQYLPTQELRDIVLERPAKIEDLRRSNLARGLDAKDLPVIHGDSLAMDFSEHANRDMWARIVDTTFRKIATAPINTLTQHPFFAGVYQREMRAQYARLALKKGEVIHLDDPMMAEMERKAKNVALRQTHDVLYDLANQSNLAHTVRFIMPFYGAFADAIGAWSKLFLQDPSRIPRTFQIFNAPNKSPRTYTDQYGGKYFAVPLPAWAKGGHDHKVGMPSDTLKDIIFTGKYWYSPGFGPPVTVPVAALARNRPDIATAVEPILPFGAGNSYLDQVLPTSWRKGISLYKKDDDEAYAKIHLQMLYAVDVENNVQHHQWTDEEMLPEAKRRTDALFGLKMFESLALPFAANNRSPGQLYTDAYREMQAKFRKDPHAFPQLDDAGQPILDETGKPIYLEPLDKFIDGQGGGDKGYGMDYFAYTLANTKGNAGSIPITDNGFRGFEQHKALIEEFPDMAQLIVGDDPDGSFSTAVYEWMLHHKIDIADKGGRVPLRKVFTPKEALANLQVQRGWAEFNRAANAVAAAANDSGASTAEEQTMRDAAEATIRAKNPAWADAMDKGLDKGVMRRRITAMEAIVNDPKLKGRAGFASLAQYLAARRDLVDAKTRGVDATDVFDAKVADLRRSDTAFEDIYNRWLDKDNPAYINAKSSPVNSAPPTPTPAANVRPSSARPTPTPAPAPAAPAQQAPAGTPTPTPKPAATPKPATAVKGNLSTTPVSHNADGSVSKLQTTTFTENGQSVVIPYAGPDGHRLSKADAIAQYKATGKFVEKR